MNSAGLRRSGSHCVQAFPRPARLGHSVHSLICLLWPHWEDWDFVLELPLLPPYPVTDHM